MMMVNPRSVAPGGAGRDGGGAVATPTDVVKNPSGTDDAAADDEDGGGTGATTAAAAAAAAAANGMGLKPCTHQVAGHLFEEGKAGSLVDGKGRFYKPIQPGPRGNREGEFYDYVTNEKNRDVEMYGRGMWTEKEVECFEGMMRGEVSFGTAVSRLLMVVVVEEGRGRRGEGGTGGTAITAAAAAAAESSSGGGTRTGGGAVKSGRRMPTFYVQGPARGNEVGGGGGRVEIRERDERGLVDVLVVQEEDVEWSDEEGEVGEKGGKGGCRWTIKDDGDPSGEDPSGKEEWRCQEGIVGGCGLKEGPCCCCCSSSSWRGLSGAVSASAAAPVVEGGGSFSDGAVIHDMRRGLRLLPFSIRNAPLLRVIPKFCELRWLL